MTSTQLRAAGAVRRGLRAFGSIDNVTVRGKISLSEWRSGGGLMPSDPVQPGAAMEGQGSYNRHGRLPAGGGALALPHLERAIAEVPLDSGVEPVVIADYGSSQGKNSLAPMGVAISAVRARTGPARPILVCHEDQPSNDFNALIGLLHSHPDRYQLADPNVFPCVIGRSFYEGVLPENFVHVGWSSYAATWISRIPALIPGHIFFARSNGEVRAAFERQGASDWQAFLALRARELRPGGCLVVVVPGADERGVSGMEAIFDHANAVLGDMVSEGTITADERRRMVLNVWPRRKAELVAPFDRNGRLGSLALTDTGTRLLRDAAWDDYEKDGNAQALAEKHAMFFRAIFAPTLASALTRVREDDAAAFAAFADRLTTGLRRHLEAKPAQMHSLVQIVAVTKTA
jgi:SAM dependent carboxyl methyltransferase